VPYFDLVKFLDIFERTFFTLLFLGRVLLPFSELKSCNKYHHYIKVIMSCNLL